MFLSPKNRGKSNNNKEFSHILKTDNIETGASPRNYN